VKSKYLFVTFVLNIS